VVVNISAKDKDGNPVKGLKPTDFTVTEDGKPQTVKVFEFQELKRRRPPRRPPRPPQARSRSRSGRAGQKRWKPM